MVRSRNTSTGPDMPARAGPELLARLLASIPDAFWVVDTHAGQYRFVNAGAENIFGLPAAHFYADPQALRPLLVDDADWQGLLRCASAAQHHEPQRFRIRRPDGALRWVELRSYPLAANGDTGGTAWRCGVCRDITDQVETEQALRTARDTLSERARDMERRLQLLIDATSEYAIFMLQPDGTVASWNEGARRLKGYEAEQIIGRDFAVFYPAEERLKGRPRRLLRLALANGSATDEGWRLRSDGSAFWASVLITPVVDEQGTVRGYGKVVKDLSEQHAAEQRQQALIADLRQSRSRLEAANTRLEKYGQRLQAVSARLERAQEDERRQIARELHDDIGQRVTALRLLLRSLPAGPASKARAGVDQAVLHTGRLLEALRAVTARLHPAELDDLGLVPALRRLLRSRTQGLDVHTDLSCDGGDDPLPEALSTACYRIAQEAVNNALHHSRCGTLHVRVAATRGELHLTVEDDGDGFDVERALTRTQEGASFGLLSMRERARLNGGTLEIVSDPGLGTRISARIPTTADKGPAS